jgi:hypothetical protein
MKVRVTWSLEVTWLITAVVLSAKHRQTLATKFPLPHLHPSATLIHPFDCRWPHRIELRQFAIMVAIRLFRVFVLLHCFHRVVSWREIFKNLYFCVLNSLCLTSLIMNSRISFGKLLNCVSILHLSCLVGLVASISDSLSGVGGKCVWTMLQATISGGEGCVQCFNTS